jgi:hypothetical protein
MNRYRASIRAGAFLGCMLLALAVLGAGAVPAAAAKGHDEKVTRAPIKPAPEPGQPLGPPMSAAQAAPPATATAAPSCLAANTLDLKVLVLSGNGKESDLPAIRRALDGLGTPYTVWVATERPGQLTSAQLASGCHGFYQAVLLTNASLGYSNNGTWVRSGMTAAEWQALYAYEASFGVRQVNWYTSPSPDTGFNWPSGTVDTTRTPLTVSLTAQGRTVFPYIRQGVSLPIQGAWTYLATPLADGATTPLVADAAGHALAAIRTFADGRQALSLTFDDNPTLIQDLVLWYGLVNWATRGIFVGQRHVYLPAQVDDLFSPGAYFPPDRPCGQPLEPGVSYRTTGGDLTAFTAWQRATRRSALGSDFRVSFAFIGSGTTGYPSDTLVPAAQQNARHFNWIDHTYHHLDLDSVDYATASSEITRNTSVSAQLGLRPYTTANLVTPALTGLSNPAVLQAAYDTGVHEVVTSPVSKSWTDPSPNAGVSLQGGFGGSTYAIVGIPRRDTNLFWDVSTPEQWVAQDHCLYPAGQYGYAATYDDILNRESSVMLTYLLSGDVNPLGFHALNIRAYDGSHSLLGDLVDRTLQRYAQLVNVPFLSPTMDEVAALAAQRNQLDRARPQLIASITTSSSGRLLHVISPTEVTLPITGLRLRGSETYAGQSISYLKMQSGKSVSVQVPN